MGVLNEQGKRIKLGKNRTYSNRHSAVIAAFSGSSVAMLRMNHRGLKEAIYRFQAIQCVTDPSLPECGEQFQNLPEILSAKPLFMPPIHPVGEQLLRQKDFFNKGFNYKEVVNSPLNLLQRIESGSRQIN